MFHMASAKSILEQFFELAQSRCVVNLKDGTCFEGYLLEVHDQDIAFGEGGPLASTEDLVLTIDDVCFDELHFYSNINDCYMHAQWNVQYETFVIKRSKKPEIVRQREVGPCRSDLSVQD